MHEQGSQSGRDEAREGHQGAIAEEGGEGLSTPAMGTGPDQEATGAVPASPPHGAGGTPTGEGPAASEVTEAGGAAEEGAARLFTTEFMTPPTEPAAVQPASPDWEVAAQQPRGAPEAHGQEAAVAPGAVPGPVPATAPSDDAASRRSFLSDWSQSVRGEEAPRQVAEDERLSSPGHYEAQQTATPAREAFVSSPDVAEQVPHSATAAQDEAPASPPLSGETTAIVSEETTRTPAPAAASEGLAPVVTEMAPREEQPLHAVEAEPAAQAEAAPAVPTPAEAGEGVGTAVQEGEEAAATAAAPARLPRVAPLPQRSMDDLAEGQVIAGRVKNLAAFGAFVDLGLRERKDGLIHVSQLADRRIGHPSEVVQIGQEVQVRVLSVDRDKGRISLSLRGADEPHDAPASYSTAPIEEPPAPQGEATMQSLIERFGRQQAHPATAPQRDTRRAERERREREEILRRMRGE